ncbi:oligosaccharide flippase family protein [Rossellomorea marisflavi]|uniref:oligosaccharide flippase family protein n=1 Tax=Rossellomorea marisflavi TaxID=189381 RepID=UPI001652DC5F|nr:oligosaccharide flippase family protein [Rossellomorea marisflavi]
MFKTNAFIKAVNTLITGTLIAQIIAVASSPIITRMYTPAEFGFYTLVLSILTIFGSTLTGRYDLSVVSTKDEKEVYPLIIACFILTLIFSTIVSIGFVTFLTKYGEIFNSVGWFVFSVYPMLLLTGFINTLSSYNNRYKEYKVLSRVSIYRSLTQTSSQIALGYFGYGVKGLLTSNIIASLVGFRTQSKRIKANYYQFKKVKLNNIKEVLLKYRHQLFFSTPAVLVNTLSYSLINFLIADLYSSAVLGYYSLSYRILGLPLSLISMNVARVFFEQASKEFNETGKCTQSFKKTFIFLLFLAVPMAFLLIILGPYIFKILFGTGWDEAGIYVQILAPMFALRFIILSLTSVLVITGNQKIELKIQSLFIFSTILTYIICLFYNLTIFTFLSLISSLYIVCYLFFGLVLYKFSRRKFIQ